jgi:hypothetical protein
MITDLAKGIVLDIYGEIPSGPLSRTYRTFKTSKRKCAESDYLTTGVTVDKGRQTIS